MSLIALTKMQIGRFRASTYWRDIAWLSMGSVAGNVLTVAIMPIVSRLYTPADVAVANLFGVISGFAAVVATLRFEYFVQLPRDDDDALQLVRFVFTMAGVTFLIATPLLWFARDWLAPLTGDLRIAPWLVFLPVSAVAYSISVAVQGWAQRNRKFRLSAISDIAAKGSGGATQVAGHWLFPDPGGLIFATFFSSLGRVAAIGLPKGLLAGWDLPRVKALGGQYSPHAMSLVVSHVFLSITTGLPSFIISHQYGADILGQYALAYPLVCAPTALLGNAIGNVYYQRAAETWNQGREFRDIWKTTAVKLLLIGVPTFVSISLVSTWIFPIIFGSQWVVAGRFASILVFGELFSFVTAPLGRSCLIVGANWYLPVWHGSRSLTSALVAVAAWKLNVSIDGYLWLLISQAATLYLIDYAAQWRFSGMRPSVPDVSRSGSTS